MTDRAITVRAPLTRLDVDDNTLARSGRSLIDRPAHRAGNVSGFELLTADLDGTPS